MAVAVAQPKAGCAASRKILLVLFFRKERLPGEGDTSQYRGERISNHNVIIVENISKKWGSVTALDEVSLCVPRGVIHGLIGADGAGKSTLFDILVALTAADSGRAVVGGSDVRRDWQKVRSSVGYMPTQFSLYGDLSVAENLRFFANIYQRDPAGVNDLIGNIWRQIEPFSPRPAATLSGGMKQKLALCCAMIHDPDVLFLDEPTTGVDPTSRREFWEVLRGLAAKGKTIVVSTSYMDEAEQCDRITMLHHGRVLGDLDPRQVSRDYNGMLYRVTMQGTGVSGLGEVQAALQQWDAADCYSYGDGLHLSFIRAGARGDRPAEQDTHSPSPPWPAEQVPTETSWNEPPVKPSAVPSDEAIRAYLHSRGIGTDTLTIVPAVPSVEDLFIELVRQYNGAEHHSR